MVSHFLIENELPFQPSLERTKRVFTIILGSLLSIMNCFSVFAVEPEIAPHYEATPCFVCDRGNVHTERKEIYLYREVVDGITYDIYDVTITVECDTCDYKDVEHAIVHRPI